MPTFESGRRPESIARFVGMTEYPSELTGRVTDRQRIAEKEITSVSALAHIFLETGGRYIQAVYDEMPNGTAHLHPYKLGGFGKLSEDDQQNVKQAFSAVIIGASVLALTDMMKRDMGTFDREYFLSLYNVRMGGTGLPTVTLKDIPLRIGESINDDGDEVVPEFHWGGLERRYNQAGFADFLGSDMWDSLPPSLQEFVRLQGSNLANDVKVLYGSFAERAKALVQEERKEAAVRQELLRREASLFYEANFDFDLDPQGTQRPTTSDEK